MRRPTSYRNALNPSSKTKARLTGGPGSAPCYSSCATSLRPAISRSVTANGSRGWRSSSSTTAAGRACVRTFFAVLVCPPTARRYASLKTGHVTASVALKRLVGFIQRQKPFLPRQSGSRAYLQDRVHPPVPLGAGIAQPDPARLAQSRATPRLGQGRLLRAAGPD